jgi:hypothetical protein
VAVGEGVDVSVMVEVEFGAAFGCCVLSLAEINGSYVGNTMGASVAGAQETTIAANKNSETILEKDMDVILPKDKLHGYKKRRWKASLFSKRFGKFSKYAATFRQPACPLHGCCLKRF